MDRVLADVDMVQVRTPEVDEAREAYRVSRNAFAAANEAMDAAARAVRAAEGRAAEAALGISLGLTIIEINETRGWRPAKVVKRRFIPTKVHTNMDGTIYSMVGMNVRKDGTIGEQIVRWYPNRSETALVVGRYEGGGLS